jgi:hypothetical protein
MATPLTSLPPLSFVFFYFLGIILFWLFFYLFFYFIVFPSIKNKKRKRGLLAGGWEQFSTK